MAPDGALRERRRLERSGADYTASARPMITSIGSAARDLVGRSIASRAVGPKSQSADRAENTGVRPSTARDSALHRNNPAAVDPRIARLHRI